MDNLSRVEEGRGGGRLPVAMAGAFAAAASVRLADCFIGSAAAGRQRVYVNAPFSVALIEPLEFGGNPRADLAASERVFRTAESIGYGHCYMP